MLRFNKFISFIGGPEVMTLAVVALFGFLYVKGHELDADTVLSATCIAMTTTYILKFFLKVPRPKDMLVTEEPWDYRFPSGHATMSSVLMVLGMYYAHEYVVTMVVRDMLYVFLVLWFLSVSYSRLYLRVHRVIDVIVGGLIGTLSALFVLWY